jgi:hypothetical protein
MKKKRRPIPRVLQPYWLADFYRTNPEEFIKLDRKTIELHVRRTNQLIKKMYGQLRRGATE